MYFLNQLMLFIVVLKTFVSVWCFLCVLVSVSYIYVVNVCNDYVGNNKFKMIQELFLEGVLALLMKVPKVMTMIRLFPYGSPGIHGMVFRNSFTFTFTSESGLMIPIPGNNTPIDCFFGGGFFRYSFFGTNHN